MSASGATFESASAEEITFAEHSIKNAAGYSESGARLQSDRDA